MRIAVIGNGLARAALVGAFVALMVGLGIMAAGDYPRAACVLLVGLWLRHTGHDIEDAVEDDAPPPSAPPAPPEAHG